ncbi:MAG: 2-hydroxyacid dehydrogenase [Deltaproteobacteria bacterium]|nr:2-hydroxyacid dehydrogenase [Deltaproteobacteria bacterium]
MKVALFSCKAGEEGFFEACNKKYQQDLFFFQSPLTRQSTKLAKGFTAISVFVNDCLNEEVLEQLKKQGTQLITLRCAGYDHVDLEAANELKLHITYVPDYSPYAVAEHALALMLCLNRQLIASHEHVQQANFSLKGLMGFDMYGKTIGIVGTGKIGSILVKMLRGLGCQVLAVDPVVNPECIQLGAQYVDFDKMLENADIISLNCPLNSSTKYLINHNTLKKMKDGVMLINISRGAVLNTSDVIDALKSKKIAYLGIDVYEKEKGLFFEDHSEEGIHDETLSELLNLPNVLVTPHQAFYTREAMENISQVTLENIHCFEKGLPLKHELTTIVSGN